MESRADPACLGSNLFMVKHYAPEESTHRAITFCVLTLAIWRRRLSVGFGGMVWGGSVSELSFVQSYRLFDQAMIQRIQRIADVVFIANVSLVGP